MIVRNLSQTHWNDGVKFIKWHLSEFEQTDFLSSAENISWNLGFLICFWRCRKHCLYHFYEKLIPVFFSFIISLINYINCLISFSTVGSHFIYEYESALQRNLQVSFTSCLVRDSFSPRVLSMSRKAITWFFFVYCLYRTWFLRTTWLYHGLFLVCVLFNLAGIQVVEIS